MFYKLKKIILFFPIILLLNACVNTGKNVLDSGKNAVSSAKEKIFNSENKDNNIGVNLDEENSNQKEDLEYYSNHRSLNIIIPTFDPGIEEDEDVFEELRNFESRRFAVKLKVAIEDTNRVGAVRVTPNTSASGQIYVIGKIKKSNGQKIKLKIKVIDASGKKIMDKKFSKKIDISHYDSVRTKNSDAYNELFDEIATSY
jgi:hypothetical protein